MKDELMDIRLNKLLSISENVVSRVESVEARVENVETTLDRFAIIHSGQAKKLRQIANKRVRQLLPDDEQYKQLRGRYYSWLWNKYQDSFGVTSYTDTRLKHFDAALDWINEWQPIQSVSMNELREASMKTASSI